MSKFSKLINGVKFQLISKDDLLNKLEYYANASKDISQSDFNNIFILYSIKDKYFKNELIKRLTQKTIINAISDIVQTLITFRGLKTLFNPL